MDPDESRLQATSQGDGRPVRELDAGLRTVAFNILTPNPPSEASAPPTPPPAKPVEVSDPVMPGKMS